MRPADSGADYHTGMANKIQRYLGSRGPVTISAIKTDLALPRNLLSDSLNRMLADKLVIHGKLIENLDEKQWCDRHNFNQLYRTAIVRRRTVQNPADRTVFNRFLLQWHGVAKPGQPLREVLQRYRE